jgi:phage baseplate assembly protein W
MLRDIYAIPNSEGRYKPGVLEVNNELDEIIQQVDCLLFTRRGEVLMMPDFGCDLHKYFFDTNWNKMAIKHMIESQINTYIYLDGKYRVEVDVEFIKWEFNVAMTVDLKINGKKVSSYLV